MTVNDIGHIRNRLIGRVMEVVDSVHDNGDLSATGRTIIRGRIVSAVHQAVFDIESLAENRDESKGDSHEGDAPHP